MADEFYVGYLALPPGYRRFLRVLLPMLVIGSIVAAVVITSQQNDPGDGSWNLAEPVTMTGILTIDPYAMLIVNDDSGVPSRRILLVTMGKIGGEGLDLPDHTQTATITGYPIGRDGTVLLTIENPASDVEVSKPAIFGQTSASLGQATLVGEIIDPKCYFGAMKPGEGKVHKACATLCIAGGVPPMFMTQGAAGDLTYYLLVDQNGRGITGEALDALLPFVADPVKIEGEIARHGDLLVLKTDPTQIERR